MSLMTKLFSKGWIVTFSALALPLCGERSPPASPASHSMEQLIVPHLEWAVTQEQKGWGLMGRRKLPWDEGMLFFMDKEPGLLWSFNCWIDLDVACFDQQGVLLKVLPLFAYPEKMDPRRPVTSLSDLSLYPMGDPIRHFFIEQAVRPPPATRYLIEMNLGWFAAHQLHEKAQLFFPGGSNQVALVRLAP